MLSTRDIIDLKQLTADAVKEEKRGNHDRWRTLGDLYLELAKLETNSSDINTLRTFAKMAYAMETTSAVLSVEEALDLRPFPFSTPETNEFIK